jgi:hypothetical protein
MLVMSDSWKFVQAAGIAAMEQSINMHPHLHRRQLPAHSDGAGVFSRTPQSPAMCLAGNEMTASEKTQRTLGHLRGQPFSSRIPRKVNALSTSQ